MGIAPVAMATTFFSDDFTGGSVTNSAVPVVPTANSTAYQFISAKAWSPTPTIAPGHLKFGIAATTGGTIEAQGLFATNPAALTVAGDYIQLIVTFTNTSGNLLQAGAFGFGLYNSSQSFPVTSGLNGTATTSASDHATGGAAPWEGYVGQLGFSGQTSQILTRQPQTGTANNNQDLVTSGSTSQSYRNPTPSTVGTGSSSYSLTLSAGQPYTEVLTISLVDATDIAITNTFYAGTDTNAAPLSQFGGVASGSTFLTTGFDSFAIGWRAQANTFATAIDIQSVQVIGSVTAITSPPTITLEPVPVSVPNGGSCAFFTAAQGIDVTYQWKRFGTNLVNGGNISGATSDTLVISPAGPADLASALNGYFVTISGAGGFSTNSVTNSLSFRTAANLLWTAVGGTTWDLANTVSWVDSGSNPTVFNFGDSVTFDDSASVRLVTLTGSYLSASSMTVSNTLPYIFNGTGSFAGPGKLLYIGSGTLTLNNANSHTGGTIISNAAASVMLQNYLGLGLGPVTLAMAGGFMEVVPAGNANSGINGDVTVADDFTIQFDASGAFSGVFLGDLSGTLGKTLTITNGPSSATPSRVRVFGTNTVFNANLNLNDARTVWASYQTVGSQTYNGLVSGPGAFMEKGTTTTFNGDNTFSGGTYPATGVIAVGLDSTGNPPTSGPLGTGPIFLMPDSTTSTTASGQILAVGGPHTLSNPIQYPSATNNQTLIIGGTNALTFSGPITLNGNDFTGTFTNRIFQATNTALTTFSGVISDGGTILGISKTGNGTLALSAANTYTGPTFVDAGMLLVNGQIAGPATVTNGTLAGSGSIAGAVTVQTPGAVSAGSATATGTLSINNTLSSSGTVLAKVTKTPGNANDLIAVTGAATLGGGINVELLGATTPSGSDTFTVLTASSVSGTFTNLDGSGRVNLVGGTNGSIHVTITGTSVVLDTYQAAPPPPLASYTATPSSGVRPLTVTFTNTSTGSFATSVWTFGDGSNATNNNNSFTHTYTNAGNFTVTLVVSGVGGSGTNNSQTIAVSVPNPPKITSATVSGGNLNLAGTGGPTGGGYSYQVFSTLNVNSPLSSWTLVATPAFNNDGTFSTSIPINSANPRQFYIIKMP